MSLNKLLQIKRWRLIENIKISADRSLKEDLLIDTTFDPSYISWDTPFKHLRNYKLKKISAVSGPTEGTDVIFQNLKYNQLSGEIVP
jgi:hypothetical protein